MKTKLTFHPFIQVLTPGHFEPERRKQKSGNFVNRGDSPEEGARSVVNTGVNYFNHAKSSVENKR